VTLGIPLAPPARELRVEHLREADGGTGVEAVTIIGVPVTARRCDLRCNLAGIFC
jgi:hypothetical protein